MLQDSRTANKILFTRCLLNMDYFYKALVFSVLTSLRTSYGSQVVSTSVGKMTTLRCEIENLVPDDIGSLFWRKDGTTVYSRTTNGENGHGRYSIIDSTSLIVPNVTESDAGNYSCKIIRRSFTTYGSEITQLYVTGITVSHCKDMREDIDGCSCFINGSNITSLECSASGFRHPPAISWEKGHTSYRTPYLDLTMFSDNINITCKARDENMENVMANKTVCIYYHHYQPESSPTDGSVLKTIPSSMNAPALLTVVILLSIILVILICFVAAHKFPERKKELLSRLSKISPWTSTPKRNQGHAYAGKPLRKMNSSGYDAENVNVMKDSWKNSKGSNLGDLFSKDDDEDISEIEVRHDDIDAPKDCNEGIVVKDEPPIPLVGQVLLNDLRSASDLTKDSIKSVIVELISKRKDSYEVNQSYVEPTISVQPSVMNMSLQKSVKPDPDTAFVYMVLDDLDQILDERDRDECEILITKPDFLETTEESQIPAYEGSRVIKQKSLLSSFSSHPMQASMTSSMMGYSSLSTVLVDELRRKPSERTAMRNTISKIILDAMKEDLFSRGINSTLSYSTGGLQGSSILSSGETNDEVSQLVAFWTSKTVKLHNKVNNRIKKCLFPFKPINTKKKSDADSELQSKQEDDKIPVTAKLLEDNS